LLGAEEKRVVSSKQLRLARREEEGKGVIKGNGRALHDYGILR